MNREQAKDLVEFLNAYVSGKHLQIRRKFQGCSWEDINNANFDPLSPLSTLTIYEWRIKPEKPKPREVVFLEKDGELNLNQWCISTIYGHPLMLREGCRFVRFVEVIPEDQ